MASMVPYGHYNRALSRTWPFDGFFDDVFAPLAASADAAAAFKMDVEDAGDAYVVSAELPGVGREGIDVELNEGRLSISASREESEEDKGKNYLHKETRAWSATRGVYLKDAASEGLSARLDGGVLTVRVPKQDARANVTKVAID